jgi:hypothetical protein
MLSQTKRAIDTLKAAGFKRSEIRVRVTRNWHTCPATGKRGYEYGPLSIITGRVNPAIHDIQMIVDNGYDVTQYVGFRDDRTAVNFGIFDNHNRRAKFQVWDGQAEEDEHGFNFAKTYYVGKPQWEKRW